MNRILTRICVAVVMGFLSTRAADVAYYGLFKYQQFTQESESAPTLENGSPYSLVFGIQQTGTFTGQVFNATVRLPNGKNIGLESPMPGTPEVSTWWGTNVSVPADLTSAFPTGTYTMNFETAHDGSKSLALVLSADAFPETAPWITNWSEIQWVDASKPLTIRWSRFVAGSPGAIVFMNLGNTFRTAVYQGEPGYPELTPESTSVTIPGGVLPDGALLYGSISFENDVVLDTDTYPGALGYVGFGKTTAFRVQTLPRLMLDPITLTSESTPEGVVIRWDQELGLVQLERRESLLVGDWTQVPVPEAEPSYWEWDPEGPAFFRLRFLPPTFTGVPKTVEVSEGQDVQLEVGVSGTGPMLMQWRKDGVNMPSETDRILYLRGVQLGDSGSYSLVATNRVGLVESPAISLTVTGVVPESGSPSRGAARPLTTSLGTRSR